MTFYSVKKKVDNVYLIREKDKLRSRELAAVVIALAPLAIFLLAYTWESIELIRLGYANDRLERRRDELSELNKQLTLEIAALSSLDRVEKQAVTELGLTPPSEGQVVFLAASPSNAAPLFTTGQR